jgi:hypothetical protein
VLKAAGGLQAGGELALVVKRGDGETRVTVKAGKGGF